jgi:dienelactone hydrolase
MIVASGYPSSVVAETTKDGLKSLLAFVDPDRIAVAGCSYGGIQTLLGAERNVGYKAAISISPAALSWAHNSFLQKRLVQSFQKINIPVLLLQPARDASLEPSRVLGAEAARLGKSLTTKVYPDTGPEDERGHCFGGAKGMHVWAEDAKVCVGTRAKASGVHRAVLGRERPRASNLIHRGL